METGDPEPMVTMNREAMISREARLAIRAVTALLSVTCVSHAAAARMSSSVQTRMASEQMRTCVLAVRMRLDRVVSQQARRGRQIVADASRLAPRADQREAKDETEG